MDEISKNKKNERSVLTSKAGKYLVNNCLSTITNDHTNINQLDSDSSIGDTQSVVDTLNQSIQNYHEDVMFTNQPVDDYLYDISSDADN